MPPPDGKVPTPGGRRRDQTLIPRNDPHSHDQVEPDRSRQAVIFGAHSAWACMARSYDRPGLSRCPQCCRCTNPDHCEHPQFAEAVA
jgi:hypothetical protein